jgi:AcrR family transcriptional regulator
VQKVDIGVHLIKRQKRWLSLFEPLDYPEAMADKKDKRPLRSDAARRRRAVLDAARSLFSAEGIEVPMERIAAQAGVGRATVHRNFLDRKGLLVALLDEELDRFAADVAEADLRKNPIALIDAFAALSLNNVVLLPHWQAMGSQDGEFSRVREKFLSIVELALVNVSASGRLRKDLKASDLELIAGMLGAAMKGDSENTRRALAARALEIIKNGVEVF